MSRDARSRLREGSAEAGRVARGRTSTGPARAPSIRMAACVVTLAAAVTGAAWTRAAEPDDSMMPAAAPGLDESGVPAFNVTSIDSIGLTSAPTDISQLPDGRMVVVAGTRIAFGDGSAWQVFGPAASQDGSALQIDLVVASDGGLYNGTLGGVQKIELQSDGRWIARRVATVPDTDHNRALPFQRAFRAGDRWLWVSSGGAIYSWRPGEDLQPVADIAQIEYATLLDGRLLLHQAMKGFVELRDGQIVHPPAFESLDRAKPTVRATLRTGPNQMLIGTQVNGLLLYDGGTVRPFPLDGGTTKIRQANDLCRIDDRRFAAAAGPDGVVFFDRDGHILQVLDRSLDPRFGSVRRLRAIHGVLWALLHDGVARIEFPSPVTDFTPLAPSTMTDARPVRHEGRLWLLADGVTLRAEYSPAGGLRRLVRDGPDNTFVWSLASVDGVLLACGDTRIHQRTAAGWEVVLEDAVNARIGGRAPDGRRLYVARGGIGWMTVRDGRPHFERRHESRLGDNYGIVQDAAGAAWLELGVGQVGRVDLRQPAPVLQIHDHDGGLPKSWAQICLFDGEAVFSVADNVYRLDPASGRFSPHAAVSSHFGGMRQALGRFGRDAFGRIWVSAEERLIVDAEGAHPGSPPPPLIPDALQSAARGFVMETGGVVWIQARQRLLRYDPGVPPSRLDRVQPVITHVRLARAGMIYSPDRELHLPFTDNMVEIHFAAPRNPFHQQVSYEVRVHGLNDSWFPVGSAPVATYQHVHEGTYRFRVRAMVNGRPEGEASLDFTVSPPLYRSTGAYSAYAAGILGLLGLIAGAVTWVNRRERRRLASLVESRTAELRLSQEQLQRAVESASLGIWDYDFVADRMTWNTHFGVMYGLAADAPTQSRASFESIIHPDDREAVRRTVDLAVEQHAELRVEHRIVHPSGAVRWVAAMGRVVYDEAGRPASLRGVAIDITERRLVDEELRHRELLQRHMIDSSPVAMLMVDRNCRVLFGNGTFTRLFGYTPADVPDIQAWWPLAYPDPEYREQVSAEWFRRMERATERHEPIEPMEAVVTCRDGTRRTIHFATSEVGDRMLVVFTDLTERKAAEQAAREMNLSLERRVKERTAELEIANRELESFSYSISHDLRAPLRGIDGWSLALVEDFGDKLDETARGYLHRVRAETQRLGQLIDDMLKLARTTRTELRPAPVDLSALVAQTAQRVAAGHPAGRVQFTCQPGLTAHADAGLIGAALYNLLDNAWKFSGRVDEPRVEFGLAGTPSGPAFFVRDNGAGFEMRHARKLFGVFQRMHSLEEFPGTGIGLATVQRIIHRHGGHIWAESAPGQGATFFFTLRDGPGPSPA